MHSMFTKKTTRTYFYSKDFTFKMNTILGILYVGPIFGTESITLQSY